VTSNVSSCPEIAQKAALQVDPNSPDDIMESVVKILEDRSLRQGLREKGFRRAGDFSFHKTAQQTLAVYEEAFNQRGLSPLIPLS